MQYTAFRLAFRSPVHIGSNRPGFEHTERYIHSDTLFSALMQSWSVLFPHDLERFFSDGEEPSVTFPYFQISSAFPWIGENYFFPRPYRSTGPLAVGEPSPRRAKQIKRLVWLEQSLFEAWLNGSPPAFKPEETFGDGVFWSPGQKEGKTDNSSPFRTEDSARIIMNRNTNETTPFYFTRLFFAPNAGLFFLARFKDDSWRKKFTAALRLLGDEGLGGDRSVGHG
ncbi:MAG: type III-A CRISPR-associated RAMP protein Csm4, partial [Fidelibacterota bacterium]